jgi:hypothetical protein
MKCGIFKRTLLPHLHTPCPEIWNTEEEHMGVILRNRI